MSRSSAERSYLIGGADPLDRLIRRRLVLAPAGVRGTVALPNGGLVQRVERRVGAGEPLAVAAGRHHAGALQRHHTRLQAADPFVEIGDPARLAHLPVIDYVDARVDLAIDDVLHRTAPRSVSA
jgi:hypothetical protein